MSIPELSIIVPTYNEIENVQELIQRLDEALKDICWEVIFVDDDSEDYTYSEVRKFALIDPRIRCLRRIHKRGLSSAVIEGALATASPYIAVIDCDLQHDESLLPRMFSEIKSSQYDIVVGSRYMKEKTVEGWEKYRLFLSRLGTQLSQRLLNIQITDPLSGFFVIRRTVFESVVKSLSGIGYKILMDIIACHQTQLRILELPYEFKARQFGESKLDNHVVWDFILLLSYKSFGRAIPLRFFSFCLVGAFGVLVHLFILRVLMLKFGYAFLPSQSITVLLVIFLNFLLNNTLTYADRQLKGWQWIRGLISFYFVCALGALSNIAMSSYVYQLNLGWFFAAIAGIAMGGVWNYALSSYYTWDHEIE